VTERARTWVEVLVVFALATAAASVLYHLQSVPFIKANLHALVAAVFLILPQVMLRRRGDIEKYGFTTRPRALGLKIAAIGVLVILPLFVACFYAYSRAICAWAPSLSAGSCYRLVHPIPRLPDSFLMLTAAQLIVVGLPEELFFRGYVQGRLEEALPPTRTVWGAKLGWAWIISAVLFGIGHYLVTFEPQMLTRMFPGLVFGWMFARTRSILAGTIFHAACNLLMDVLNTTFFV
jgi:uncharacterized protein